MQYFVDERASHIDHYLYSVNIFCMDVILSMQARSIVFFLKGGGGQCHVVNFEFTE